MFSVADLKLYVSVLGPAFGAIQGVSSGSPVVTLHPQLALQQQNPQQPTMFPPSSQHSGFPSSQAIVQTSQAQPVSQMMSVIAQAPPMSTPASVIQHPPSSQSPQPAMARQTATPPPQNQVMFF